MFCKLYDRNFFFIQKFFKLICRCMDTDCVRVIKCGGDYDCPDSVPDCDSNGECTNYECTRHRPCQVSNIIKTILLQNNNS